MPFLNGDCDESVYVVLHAAMCSGETAFGGDQVGTNTGNGNNGWWFYAIYEVACCDDPPEDPWGSLQTAFALGNHVFVAADPKGKGKANNNPDNLTALGIGQRWGWAIRLDASEATCPLWAGAGQNDTSKGTLVGEVTLTWDGTDLVVACDLDAGYSMEEIQVYASDEPPTTTAPGQYGYVEYFDPFATSFEESFPVADAGGDGIWVIVHAVVYGAF